MFLDCSVYQLPISGVKVCVIQSLIGPVVAEPQPVQRVASAVEEEELLSTEEEEEETKKVGASSNPFL